MKDYAKRTCVICGAEFIPSYPSQICCTNKCKRHRKAYRERCHKARQADAMSALVRRVAALKKGMRTLHEKMNRLPDPVKPMGLKLPDEQYRVKVQRRGAAEPVADAPEKGFPLVLDPASPVAPILVPTDPSLAPPFIATCDTPADNQPEVPTCDALSHPRAKTKTTFKCTCLACGKAFNADRPTQTTCASCLRKYATPNHRHYRDPSYQG